MKYRPKPPCGGSHTADYSCGSHEVNCPVHLHIISRPKPPCGGSHTADYSCGSHKVNCPVYLQIMAYDIYILMQCRQNPVVKDHLVISRSTSSRAELA